MSQNAICLITLTPKVEFLDFLHSFMNYDIYVIVDDNNFDLTQIKLTYPKIIFLQIDNELCRKSGYMNTNYIILKKSVTGWDKALYFFSCNKLNLNYNYTWFMEDDVYFYNEETLINIDKKYVDNDILCNSSFQEAKLNEWLWKYIKINFSPPYYCGMMCIVRFTQNMLHCIKNYALKNKTLFFLEALFPIIAIKNNLLCYKNPNEFLTVTHREKHDLELLNNNNLYHPLKNLNDHVNSRKHIK